ncbi:Abi family protein [Nocardia sp. NPDC004168]|uniref:Abi family protein n=1 Tax=Nocardia TaxID=1817 RepID=UPI0033BB6CF4
MSATSPSLFKPAWVSSERFADFLEAADEDMDGARALYEWNASISSALFEVIHHVEVLIRNAIIESLNAVPLSDVEVPGTPWVQQAALIEEVKGRLKKSRKELSVHRIVAGVTFGFWATMFDTEFESLWRSSLRMAFKNSPGDRKSVGGVMQNVNVLRNLIAHHGSLLKLDPEIEFEKLAQLAGWVDPEAEIWIRGLERVSAIAKRRPLPPKRNVVIVAADKAWPLYEKVNAYICPHERTFQSIEYLGFYADYEVKPVFAKVVRRLPIVTFSKAESKILAQSLHADDKELATIIGTSLKSGWSPGTYQVFVLSSQRDGASKVLTQPIVHQKRGRGSAFVQNKRYFSLGSLLSATNTDHL